MVPVQNKPLFFALIAGGTILLDQITKFLIQREMPLHESVVLIQGFFSLTHIRNPGAAFGFLANQSAGFRSIFFLVISIIALSLLLAFYRQIPKEDLWSLLAVSLLFGGAIGNLIDRIRFGEVVDFLDFYIGRYHWPAFNVADSAITIGISLLMFDLFWSKREAPAADLRGCK
ncbi:MAG: signal peptidase II [Candidatus Manganitrophaceae bacterium]